jgi:cytosine/adenosine deaminase-related metal-dependent hydrolase
MAQGFDAPGLRTSVPIFAGRILHRTGHSEGWVEVVDGRVVDLGKDPSEMEATATGWIVPSPVNAHTHVGDAHLHSRPDKPRNVAALVGPDGWKHQQLAQANVDDQRAAIRAWAAAAAAQGTTAFIDFREGGAVGAAMLRRMDLPVRPIIYGRPTAAHFSEQEAAELLPQVDGLGWSGLADAPMQELEQWVDACRSARKPWGLHVSEARRDDIDIVTSLEPNYVVHMASGTPADFDELAQARIPIVSCPRSNAWFDLPTPLAAMQAAECTVALGTDNAMLHDGKMLSEAQAAASLIGGDVESALRMMSWHGRDIAGVPTSPLRKGSAADVIVLPMQPFAHTARRPGLEPNMDPEAWK